MIVPKEFLLYLAFFLVGIVTPLIFEYLKKILWSPERDKCEPSRDRLLQKFMQYVVIGALVLAIIILFYYGTRESIPTGFDNSISSKSLNNNKGYNLYKAHEYEKAIESFDKALEDDPDYALAWGNKGKALEGLRCYGLADEAFAKARSLQLSLCTPCP